MSFSDSEEKISRVLRDLTESQRESAETAPAPFPQIPRYDVQQLVGEGATAVVYRAWDRELQIPVALKVLKETAGWSDVTRQRFRREAQTTAGLNHPHLVRVFDVGETPTSLYLVMELVEGRPFSAVLRDGPPDLAQVVRIVSRIARGVAAAHEKGVVHRDLKPANVLIGRDGQPKVADFGLAHLGDTETALTKSGTVLGTPLYMAPEQVLGKVGEITARTDVYGLGAILYEALTGRPPHPGETVGEIYGRIVHEEIVPPRRLKSSLPRDLETICMKALEREQERRTASASEFADDLDRFLADEPIRAKPPTLLDRVAKHAARHRAVLSVAMILVTLGAAFFLWWRSRTQQYEVAWRAGEEAWSQRKGEEALELFRRAAEADPQRAEPWVMIGRAEIFLGRAERAFEAWEEALRRDPGNRDARFERGKETLGRHVARRLPPPVEEKSGWMPLRLLPVESREGAAEELQKIRADLSVGAGAAPECVRFVKGAIDLIEGRYKDADPPIRAYTDLNLWDATGLALLGISHQFAGRTKFAERELTSALAIRTEKAWLKVRGEVRLVLGDLEGARSDFLQAGLEEEAAPLFVRRIPPQGLLLWLRADAGVDMAGGVVTCWGDQSGSGLDAASKDPRSGPRMSPTAVNKLPALSFMGKNDELRLPNGFDDFTAGVSVFVVGEPMPQRTDAWSFVSFGSTNPPDFFLGKRSDLGPIAYAIHDPKKPSAPFLTGVLPSKGFETICAVQEPGGVGRLYRRGQQLSVETLPVLGKWRRHENKVGMGFKGRIAEIILYNRSLSETERIAVEGYLKSRYFDPH